MSRRFFVLTRLIQVAERRNLSTAADRCWPAAILIAILLSLLSPPALAKSSNVQPVLKARIDESALVTLSGNTRREANAANDRGAVADQFPLKHMMLQLRRSPT